MCFDETPKFAVHVCVSFDDSPTISDIVGLNFSLGKAPLDLGRAQDNMSH